MSAALLLVACLTTSASDPSHPVTGSSSCLMGHPSHPDNLAKQFHSEHNQVVAFCSVQDLILAAIIAHGHRASLREVRHDAVITTSTTHSACHRSTTRAFFTDTLPTLAPRGAV